MKTTLHYYLCDLTKMEGIREWKRIQRETRGVPETIGTPGLNYWLEIVKLNGQLIELPNGGEVPTLNGESINIGCGIYPQGFEGLVPFVDRYEAGFLFTHFRFDHGSKPIAEGYYLEMTDEMSEARDNTYRCPTCSSLRPNDHTYFCIECVTNNIDNEKDIYKAFFRPVSVIDVLPKNILIPSEVKQVWRESHKVIS